MNRARALIIFSACSVLALSTVAYIKHVEDSTTPLAANPALIAAESEVTSIPTKADESPGKDATSEKIAELSAELKRLDEKLALLRQEVQLRLAVPPAASNEESDKETDLGDPRTDPRALAEAERREQERIQSLENDFENESMRDLEWSSRASAALEQAFASDRAANARVNDLECRARQCRVELVFRSDTDRDKLMDWLSQELAEALPSIAVHEVEQADGSTTLVLYLFGERYEPPQNAS